MAQLSDDEILHRIVHGDIDPADGVKNLIDRQSGRFTPPERTVDRL